MREYYAKTFVVLYQVYISLSEFFGGTPVDAAKLSNRPSVMVKLNPCSDSLIHGSPELNGYIVNNSVEVIALEPDSVWFKDPYPMFRRMSSRPEVDLASPMNAVTARIGEWRAYSPMLLKPSEASVALLRKLLEKLRKHGDSDLVRYNSTQQTSIGLPVNIYVLTNSVCISAKRQIVYNYLCMARYSGVVCENFLYEDVSDGKWFGLEGSEKSVLRPYILNNNYLNGKKKKEHRQAIDLTQAKTSSRFQKKFGLWFLSEQGQCNHQAVKRKLDSFSRAAEDEHAHV
ncbi:hypothetical protein ANCCEY_14011 [Ancylostoma ceylanicum]|uniref:Nucleotide-diphospho-sugar transferase domain-containing protein n=1 Tax=Ancylostoma ceylanicum TaxID=53326 RepID=A0A0D6LAV5_9BILA|nr:hypothetical protein ANCCEY_14011 [Ancylostoma ceylanicum]